jgi:beta-fructofuranosidase
MLLLQTNNVDPASPGLNERGSWWIRNETDGSTTVCTVGQRVIPEALAAYKKDSKVSEISALTVSGSSSSGWSYRPFSVQPKSRHYAITATVDFQYKPSAKPADYPRAGFRVLASSSEYTDLFYDLRAELFNISRLHSSLVPSYNNNTSVCVPESLAEFH